MNPLSSAQPTLEAASSALAPSAGMATTATGAAPVGLEHLLHQSSWVGLMPLILLCLMSIGTVYLVLCKGWLGAREQRHGRRYLAAFWQSATLEEVRHIREGGDNAYRRLTMSALEAATQLRQARDGHSHCTLGSADEFVLRALRQALQGERLRVESGLTFLASVGSAAPFIGLFGTVWGIYHALLAIGSAGQSSIDKVAGPVGEALIMTGLGLAVALPAVLIYNFLVRRNKLRMAELDGFAHDLFALLVTGVGKEGRDGVR